MSERLLHADQTRRVDYPNSLSKARDSGEDVYASELELFDAKRFSVPFPQASLRRFSTLPCRPRFPSKANTVGMNADDFGLISPERESSADQPSSTCKSDIRVEANIHRLYHVR